MMMGFGLFGWLFMLLFTFVFLALGVVVVAWIVRQMAPGALGLSARQSGSTNQGAGRTCPTCGRVVQAGWAVCPYDGTPLEG